MHLTNEEKRIHAEHEEKRELAEVGLSSDIACTYCEDGLGEDSAHILAGETFCSSCALDEVARLRSSATWASLRPHQQLEVWEVLGAAASRLESALRADIRRKAVQ